MPTEREITSFVDGAPPPGESPWVVEPQARPITVVEYDPAWPDVFAAIETQLRTALGPRALDIVHVGSTAVPGLPAKPIIDIELIVADPAREPEWLPPLEAIGFVHTVREPWWYEHRMVKAADHSANVHVFGPDSPEPWKQRIFRDHLRRDAGDREVYAEAKRAAAASATAAHETVMEYNRRKQAVIREIYARAFRAAGLQVTD